MPWAELPELAAPTSERLQRLHHAMEVTWEAACLGWGRWVGSLVGQICCSKMGPSKSFLNKIEKSPSQFCCLECSKPLERKAKRHSVQQRSLLFSFKGGLRSRALGALGCEDGRIAGELGDAFFFMKLIEYHTGTVSQMFDCSSWRVSWLRFYPQGPPRQPQTSLSSSPSGGLPAQRLRLHLR